MHASPRRVIWLLSTSFTAPQPGRAIALQERRRARLFTDLSWQASNKVYPNGALAQPVPLQHFVKDAMAIKAKLIEAEVLALCYLAIDRAIVRRCHFAAILCDFIVSHTMQHQILSTVRRPSNKRLRGIAWLTLEASVV